MQSVKMLSDEEFATLEQAVDGKLEKAMAYSEVSPEPSPDEVETDVFAPSPVHSGG